MPTLLQIISKNQQANKWFAMLKYLEKNSVTIILDEVLKITEQYNNIIQGFEVYITGSTLNLMDRSYNDIDLMVVIPHDNLITIKRKLLTELWNLFRDNDINSLTQFENHIKTKLFDLGETLGQLKDFLNTKIAINNRSQEYLLHHYGSSNVVNRILMDPESELGAVKMRAEGLIEEERNRPTLESDGTAGFQFGPLVERFLFEVATDLTAADQNQLLKFNVQWQKSFSEGYGKIAGENNCYIYPNVQSVPVHLFLTTGVDHKKAMEKKESFMIEYYTAEERMKPIKLY
jgi:hypothetical protein